MQHAGAEYLGHTGLRHHVYLFPNDITLIACIIFAYNWSIAVAAPVKEIVSTRAPKTEGAKKLR